MCILDDLLEYLSIIGGTRFNSILLNWYNTNDRVIGFHTDDEPELGINPVIASLSLGDTRGFFLRSRTTGQQRSVKLSHGSLLVMCGKTQQHFNHAIAPGISSRINLTFRYIKQIYTP